MTNSDKCSADSDIGVGMLKSSRQLTAWNPAEASHQLNETLERARLGIVIDCGDVQLGTSEVINVLLQISRKAKEKGKLVALYNVSESLQTSIKITGLQLVIKICSDIDSAKQQIRQDE